MGLCIFCMIRGWREKRVRLAERPLGWYERLNMIKCGPIGRAYACEFWGATTIFRFLLLNRACFGPGSLIYQPSFATVVRPLLSPPCLPKVRTDHAVARLPLLTPRSHPRVRRKAPPRLLARARASRRAPRPGQDKVPVPRRQGRPDLLGRSDRLHHP